MVLLLVQLKIDRYIVYADSETSRGPLLGGPQADPRDLNSPRELELSKK